MPNREALEKALIGAHSAGDTEAATRIATELKGMSQPKSNVGLGTARSFTEGVTLGWGDEIGVGLAAIAAKISGDDKPIGAIYDDMMSAYKQEQGQFEEEHPYLATGAKVAGGLGTGVASAAKLAPSALASPASKIASYGAQGAGFGAVTGAGEAEEGEKVAGAIKGGIGGGVLGAAIPAAGMGVTKLGQRVAERLPSRAATVAGRQVAADIAEAGMDERQALASLREMGPRATLADIAPQTRARAESVAQMPGAAQAASKQFIERNVQAGRRVADAIEGLNKGKIDLGQYVDDIIARTSDEATPAYRKAFDMFSATNRPITVPPSAITARKPSSKALYDLMDDPIIQKAAASNGVQLTKTQPMGLEEWDAIKQGLDDIGYGKTATNVMGKVEGDVRKARILSRKVLNELDNIVEKSGGGTVYKDARAIYSGSAKAIEASEQGAKFWNMTPQQIDRTLKSMPASERESFKLAGLQRLYDEALKTTEGGSAYAKLFNNEANKLKIKALLQDDEAFNALKQVLKSEREFNITYKDLTQGSQTARKLAGMQEQGIDPGPAVAVAQGRPVEAFLQWATGKLKQLSIPPAQRKELADILMTPGPEAEARLRQVMTQASIKPKDRTILGQIIAAQSGMATGRTQGE